MDWRPFHYNPDTGLETRWKQQDGKVILDYRQRGLRRMVDGLKQAGRNPPKQRGPMRYVGSIPAEVQVEWVAKHGVKAWEMDHQKAVMGLLKSREYRYLLVDPSQVMRKDFAVGMTPQSNGLVY